MIKSGYDIFKYKVISVQYIPSDLPHEPTYEIYLLSYLLSKYINEPKKFRFRNSYTYDLRMKMKKPFSRISHDSKQQYH